MMYSLVIDRNEMSSFLWASGLGRVKVLPPVMDLIARRFVLDLTLKAKERFSIQLKLGAYRPMLISNYVLAAKYATR